MFIYFQHLLQLRKIRKGALKKRCPSEKRKMKRERTGHTRLRLNRRGVI